MAGAIQEKRGGCGAGRGGIGIAFALSLVWPNFSAIMRAVVPASILIHPLCAVISRVISARGRRGSNSLEGHRGDGWQRGAMVNKWLQKQQQQMEAASGIRHPEPA